MADVHLGPAPRRGVAELDGEGEVVGGIVVMRHDHNALKTVEQVKQRLDELRRGLPEGVEVVVTYDRSGLIGRAVHNLRDKLIEESLVVEIGRAHVCTPVHNAHLVCRLLLEKKKTNERQQE